MNAEKKKEEEELNSTTEETAEKELADKLVKDYGFSESTANNIAYNWKRFLGFIFILFLIFWAINGYKKGREKMVSEASFGFTQAQASFNSIDYKEDKTKQEKELNKKAKKSFEETVNLLSTESSGAGIYYRLAKFYKALGSLNEDNKTEALKELSSFNIDKFYTAKEITSSTKVNSSDFIDELSALVNLKILYEQNPLDKSLYADKLESLIKSSNLVTVEAILFSFRISTNQKEKEDVVKLAKEVITKKPEYRDLLQKELSKEGFSLGEVVIVESN